MASPGFAANLCRLCATEAAQHQPIFTAPSASSSSADQQLSSLGQMMRDCLFAELLPASGYPEVVCQFCQLQLNVFYEFKKKVLQHHRTFTEQLEKWKRADSAESAFKCDTSEVEHYLEEEEEDEEGEEVDLKVQEEEEVKVEVEEEEEDVNNGSGLAISLLGELHEDTEQTHRSDESDCEADNADVTFSEILRIEDVVGDEHSTDNEHELADIEIYQPADDQQIANANPDEDKENETQTGQDQLPDDDVADVILDISPAATASRIDDEFDEDDQLEMLVEYIDDPDDPLGEQQPDSQADEMSLDEMFEGMPKIEPIAVRVLKNGRDVEAFQCSDCEAQLMSLRSFQAHIDKSHRSRIKCRLCGLLINSDYARSHRKRHQPVRAYQCRLCPSTFTTQSQCVAHEFRHTNQRPLECPQCDKKFKLRCDLRIHMGTHSNVRKYECDRCPKSFRMLSHLRDHRETHNEGAHLECAQCPLLFKTSVTLRSHVLQVHSADHEFKCAQCGRGFYRRHKLERHMRGHEKREQRLQQQQPQKSMGGKR